MVPVITVTVAYFLSSLGGYVDRCVPFLDGCTSISKVGRYGVPFYLYKILIIPSVILMITFWYQVNQYVYKSKLLLFINITSCIFLIIYLLALGFDGKIYRFMREIGIFIFFILTPISFLIRITGNDLLKLKFSSKVKTYWIKRNKILSSMKKQY